MRRHAHIDVTAAVPERAAMVRHIERRGCRDPRVLAAMQKIPRHEFVPPALQSHAYADRPVSIGAGQTVSQPYMVAFMSEAAHLTPGAKVLEVGTGSGYQTAVLAELAATVYSIEIVPELAQSAARQLRALGYHNVVLRCGDGYGGWPDAAPFDAIVVTAAPSAVPPALLAQLGDGGRLIIPVGTQHDTQSLEIHRRVGDAVQIERPFLVRFVPMTGAAMEASGAPND